MHHQLSVLPLPAGAANIEGMDVTIVAAEARHAATTFAATAAATLELPLSQVCATLVSDLVPHFWCHTQCHTLFCATLVFYLHPTCANKLVLLIACQ